VLLGLVQRRRRRHASGRGAEEQRRALSRGRFKLKVGAGIEGKEYLHYDEISRGHKDKP
jgi:hypothetical protein